MALWRSASGRSWHESEAATASWRLAALEPRERESRAERACALVAHGRGLLRASIDEAAVGARCRERALDWRLIELEEPRVPHEGAAREALLQARDEQRELTELARAHGFAFRRLALRPEERPAAQTAVRSAAAGDLAPMLREDGNRTRSVVGSTR